MTRNTWQNCVVIRT